jgi:hypothetical protein
MRSALLDLIEESLDKVTSTVEVRAEADRVRAIAFRRDVCPRALLIGERPDPVSVIASICQQHRSWAQSGQEHRTEPIVMRLTGREAEAKRSTIGVHDGVNLEGRAARSHLRRRRQSVFQPTGASHRRKSGNLGRDLSPRVIPFAP